MSSPDGLMENTPSAWRAGTLELGTMDTEKTTGMGLRFTSLTFLVAVWFTLSAPKLTVLCAGLTNSICRKNKLVGNPGEKKGVIARNCA